MVWRGRYRPRVNFALGFGRGRRSVLLPWAAALGRCAPWEGVMSQRGLHRGPALPAGTLLFRENRPTVSKVHPLVPTQGGTLGHKNRVSAAELDSRWSLRQATIGGGKERKEVPRITRKHRVILLASGAFLAVLAMPLPTRNSFAPAARLQAGTMAPPRPAPPPTVTWPAAPTPMRLAMLASTPPSATAPTRAAPAAATSPAGWPMPAA